MQIKKCNKFSQFSQIYGNATSQILRKGLFFHAFAILQDFAHFSDRDFRQTTIGQWWLDHVEIIVLYNVMWTFSV